MSSESSGATKPGPGEGDKQKMTQDTVKCPSPVLPTFFLRPVNILNLQISTGVLQPRLVFSAFVANAWSSHRLTQPGPQWYQRWVKPSKLWANFTPLPSRLPAHPDKIYKFVKLSNQDCFWLALILFAFVCQLWVVLVLCKAPWHHANLSYCCHAWCIPSQGTCLRSWQVWPSAKARLEMIGHCLQSLSAFCRMCLSV